MFTLQHAPNACRVPNQTIVEQFLILVFPFAVAFTHIMSANNYQNFVPSWLFYIISTVSLAGVGGAALLYFYQTELIYPSNYPEGSRRVVARPAQFNMPDQEIILTTKDGVNIRAYVILQGNPEETKRSPTILFLHVSNWNLNRGHRLQIAEVLYKKLRCNVVMLSYRGYGLSEGKANEKGLRIDAQVRQFAAAFPFHISIYIHDLFILSSIQTILDFIKQHDLLKDTRLVAYGQSIGGAVAIDLVSRNENQFSGIIVENTFLSIPSLIPHVLPLLRPFTFLCHQKWLSETSIKTIVRTPILFLAGKKDELVPPIHMAALYELCPTSDPEWWREFPEGTHNDTCVQRGYFDAIREFLERVVVLGWEEGEARLKEKKEPYLPYRHKMQEEEAIGKYSVDETELIEDDDEPEPGNLEGSLNEEPVEEFTVEQIEIDSLEN
ncbi:Alpha/Beta hydrolase protein [Jimgerdemannia flammicorona]|uniref:Alpha/Beta hydrolase protein n=1 Tax=Jimgerdemannia flammicorona TaxID=994334 RepID=A0A433QP26_9FUNG|nr:Alpha/Beta hydrolase protein [Jimgerdemannia flammicorona]